MKNQNKLLLILIVGIVFLFTLNIRQSTSSIIISGSTLKDPSTNLARFDKPYKIVYHGIDDKMNLFIDHSAYKIDVYVEKNTSLGILRYLPVYKPISFESKVSYKWNNPLAKHHRDSPTNEFGKFDLSGDFNLFGRCTKNNAEKLVNEYIGKNIMTQIEKEIKNRLNP